MDHQTLTYRDTIAWLFDLQFVGIKMGLENIRSLAAFWGEPQRRYPVVHVAGTNGKGSTASFIASGLQAAGYRTGLYTSPHLVDFSERIRVDGVPIPEKRVVGYADALRGEITRLGATFFEATTLMAFRHFADEGVDIAVVETGLGGRLDATNIVRPVLTVITSISVEHTEFLGDTIAAIAAEKAGILKPGVPCVSAPQPSDAMAVLRERAAALDAPLHRVASPGPPLRFLGLDGMECELPGFDRPVDIGLAGAHQAENAATAVAALRLLRVRGFGRIDDRRITEGLREVRTRAGLRGRFEALQRAPELVVDVGHNPDGIRVMLESWSAMRPMAHTHLVFGVLRSKDLAGIFNVIRPFAPRRVTLVQAESHEAFPLDGMLRIAADEGIAAEGRGDILEAVQEALATVEEGGERSASVLLFGSHYVVGAFLREWEKNRRDTPKSLDS